MKVAIVSGFFTPAEAKIRLAFARALRHGYLVYVPVDRLEAALEDARHAEHEVLLLCGQKCGSLSLFRIEEIVARLSTSPGARLSFRKIAPQGSFSAINELALWLGELWQDLAPTVTDIDRVHPSEKITCLSDKKDTSIQTIFKDIGIPRKMFEKIGIEYRAGTAEEAKVLLKKFHGEVGPLLVAGSIFRQARPRKSFSAPVFQLNSALNVALAFLSHISEQVRHLDQASARETQRSLLPTSPFNWSGGYTLSGICIPCRLVGGDFFDWYELGDGRLALAVVDVQGKGPAAALIASEIQGQLCALFIERKSVAEVASFINEWLARHSDSSRATAVIVTLARDGQVDLINCGHVPPWKVQNGAAEIITEGVFPLGFFLTDPTTGETFLRASTTQIRQLKMEVGDRLLLLTDGITEAEDCSGQSFPDLKLVIENGGGGEHILAAVDNFRRDVPLNDDCTVVQITRS